MKKLNSILLIDDDSINNFIVVNKLRKLNMVETIISVENGKEAIDYINKCISENTNSIPELILLDINMPVMDGWEFLSEFNRIDSNITQKMYIYMVSSSVYNEDIERAKLFPSVKMFISKPLVREKIEEIIQQRLKNL